MQCCNVQTAATTIRRAQKAVTVTLGDMHSGAYVICVNLGSSPMQAAAAARTPAGAALVHASTWLKQTVLVRSLRFQHLLCLAAGLAPFVATVSIW